MSEGYKPYMTKDKYCAGFNNDSGGVCEGDSGSGHVFKNKETGRYFIYGIVSNSPFYDHPCNPNAHTLFTNVMSHIRFISNILSKN